MNAALESMFPCQATCGALPSGARKSGKKERNLLLLRSGYHFCVSPALPCGADSPPSQWGGESERRQGNMLSPPQSLLDEKKLPIISEAMIAHAFAYGRWLLFQDVTPEPGICRSPRQPPSGSSLHKSAWIRSSFRARPDVAFLP